MKLFFVVGIRHSGVVMAENKEEAVELITSENEEKDPRVLFGHVGSWESPEPHEIKLPHSYRLVKEKQ